MINKKMTIKINRTFIFRLALMTGILALVLTAVGFNFLAGRPGLNPLSNETGSTTAEPKANDSLTILPGYPRILSRTTDGIRLDVQLNQDVWRPGEKIKALLRVTNTGNQPVPWQAGSTSFGPAGSIRAVIVLQGTDVLLLEDGEPRMGTTAMLYGQLEPGESIEKTVVWTTSYTLNGDDILPAWAGDHVLQIVFSRGHDDDSGFIAWEQIVRIDADENNRQPISQDQAIGIARTLPAYDSFRLAHSGSAVAKEEDGRFWVNFGGTWENVSQELYQETLKKMMAPGAFASWENETWKVMFSEKLGDKPNELLVVLDGYTGEVLSVK